MKITLFLDKNMRHDIKPGIGLQTAGLDPYIAIFGYRLPEQVRATGPTKPLTGQCCGIPTQTCTGQQSESRFWYSGRIHIVTAGLATLRTVTTNDGTQWVIDFKTHATTQACAGESTRIIVMG